MILGNKRQQLREHTSIYSTIDVHCKYKKNHKKSKCIFWITRQLFPIILVQDPHSDPLWMKHCMSNKKIISYFQYPVNKTVFTISSKSLYTGCRGIYMWLYFNKWHIFWYYILIKYDKINGKKYHKPETTEHFFKVPGVLFCTAFNDYQSELADLLMCPLNEHYTGGDNK